jgi:hypothetical protein
VPFDLASLGASVLFELPLGLAERVVDGGVGVFPLAPLLGVAVDDELVAGHQQIDAHGIMVALVVAAMRSLDGDPAARDAIEELLELGNMLVNAGLHEVRRLEIVKHDLGGVHHGAAVLRGVGERFEPASGPLVFPKGEHEACQRRPVRTPIALGKRLSRPRGRRARPFGCPPCGAVGRFCSGFSHDR